jgi:hypothetical protein
MPGNQHGHRGTDQEIRALAAHKARGGKLGARLPQCRNLTQEAREKGAYRAGPAKAAAEGLRGPGADHEEMAGSGQNSARIAGRLNAKGHTTRRGKPWNAVQVARVLERSQAGLQPAPPRV